MSNNNLFMVLSGDSGSSKVSSLFGESEPASSSISQLFDSSKRAATLIPVIGKQTNNTVPLTRLQVLKCFSVVPTCSLFEKKAKELFVYSETSILPEAILRPDMKIELSIPPSMISPIKKERRKERPTPSKENRMHRKPNEIIQVKANDNGRSAVGQSISALFQNQNQTNEAHLDRKADEEGLEDEVIKYEPLHVSVSDIFKENNAKTEEEQQKAIVVEKKPELNAFMEYSEHSIKETDKVWYYKDLKGDVQGPFNSVEMNTWYKGGYLFKTLMISLKDKTEFHPLDEIILKGKSKTEPILPKPAVAETKAASPDLPSSSSSSSSNAAKKEAKAPGTQIQLSDLFGENASNRKETASIEAATAATEPAIVHSQRNSLEELLAAKMQGNNGNDKIISKFQTLFQ